eukprot:CAMPEP_0197660198 /NCGR_PEP_ID=MMETSP1338-20131121/50695_1 /TAXON_ID=43686 ORGANISM="Pelagodinium beii, Strain RCC1491" /NCGR_SAMPLE_ID=MMETSP1338 /ASSEMBLY_ACC=CAM_ASM_000754 /LENGTH=651 /DNA_ID=CAMNT_0043237501 /DNA_START=155 /DNA_END=2110 /DNA_ORIENTATION=+
MTMQMMGMPHQAQQPMLYQHPQPRQPLLSLPNGQVIDIPDVMAAVETLYADELKPYGRILRKRLAERAAAAGQGSVDVDIKRLKVACEGCTWLYVQAEEGGDWSALLRGRQMAFIDVYSPQDFYPAELWQSAAAYFEGLDDANMVLPGGRYSCAQALVSRGLKFLDGRTLGQVCHIVQLAISQKKLLGYLNGAVVPYGRSQSMVKERCAERQKPCTTTARGPGSDLADWEVVKNGLRDILCNLGTGVTHIPLSNIKRLFRSRFHIELSETALGHSKLSELLQDPKLRDVCSVRLQGHGYVVGPAPVQLQQARMQFQPQPQQMQLQQPPAMSAAAAGAAVIAAAAAAACGQPTPPQAAHLSGYEMSHLIQPAPSAGLAPGQANLPLYDPAQTANDTLPTVKAEKASKENRPSFRERAGFVKPLELEDDELTQRPSSGGLQNTPSTVGAPVMTPTPNASRRSRSVPRNLNSETDVSEMVRHAMGLAAKEDSLMPGTPQNPYFMPSTPESPGFPSWPILTPNTLDGMGYSVQNTFINFALPPPTPLAGSAARSHSLPRNMGASEDAEAPYQMSHKECEQPAGLGPANRLMSAAAAAVSGDFQMQAAQQVRLAHTPRGLKARGALAAAALASGTSVDTSAPAGSGHRVVRLADLL